jgi:hydroxypyruvate isomerase
MQIMEGDLIRTIGENIEYIGHFHTAGNPGRNDLDDAQEINYPPVMQAIAETDYDLYVGHEFVPKNDAIEGLQAAFDLCDVG